MKRIRVIIADDHNLFREGLGWLFEREKDLECIAVAEDGEQAIKLARELLPDVVLMDIAMPKINGIEAAKQIKRDCPSTAILILSAYKYSHYVVACIEAKVDGYLLKNTRRDELANAIRIISTGKSVFNKHVTGEVLHRLAVSRINHTRSTVGLALNVRELKVLTLAAKGKSNKQIGLELGIANSTVATHFVNIFRKLGVGSRIEAVLLALREGLINFHELPDFEEDV
jgi:NarL family two-component system response regulator LiaR